MTYKVYTERYMCIIHIYVYIKRLKEEKRTQWQEKPFNGRLLKDREKVSTQKTWRWTS